MFLVFSLLWAGAQQSFEAFLNKPQELTYDIDVTIKGKKERSLKGLFYWYKDSRKTACSMVYNQDCGHRSLMVREGKNTYHYVTYADPRNKTSKTNISNTPLHAFFAPIVHLQADERFTKTLTQTGGNGYVLEIRHFSDTKKTKEYAKIYLMRKGNDWHFVKWEIVRCDGATYIDFQAPIQLPGTVRADILNPDKHVHIS